MAFTLVVSRWKSRLYVGNSRVVKIYIIRPKPGPVAKNATPKAFLLGIEPASSGLLDQCYSLSKVTFPWMSSNEEIFIKNGFLFTFISSKVHNGEMLYQILYQNKLQDISNIADFEYKIKCFLWTYSKYKMNILE